MKQLPLPGIDSRPICPGCKRHVSLLGQWSPGNTARLCRECSLAHPMPDIFEVKLATGAIRITDDSTGDERYQNLHMENVLHRLKRGCKLTLSDADPQRGLPCEAHDYPAQWDCRLCRADLKRHTKRLIEGVPAGIAALHFRSHLSSVASTGRNQNPARWYHQMSLPVCSDCGQAHTRKLKFRDEYATRCQACEDEADAKTYYKMRAIFGDSDIEDIMDRIYNANPGLFERGVLPDRWFQLALEDKHNDRI